MSKTAKRLIRTLLVTVFLCGLVLVVSAHAEVGIRASSGTTKTYVLSIKLQYPSLVYNGSPRTQTKSMTVRAWVNKSWLVLDRADYTVSYANNTDVGTATVTVTGKGKYKGTASKTFTIVPKGTGLTSLTAGGGKLTAAWAKQDVRTDGYKLQYSTDKSFPSSNRKTITISDPSAVKKAITGLTSGTTYYVRVRTYKTVGGKTYYSAWSAVKSKKYSANVLTVSGSGTTRTVTIKNPSSTGGGLKAAVWSNKNGQDDLYWYTMKKQSDGSYQVKISATRIGNSGKCPVHVYTGENTFLNGTTCSFTADELKEAGGKSLVHTYAKAILKDTGNTLRGAYDWVVQNVPYQSMVVPMTLPKDGPYSVFTRQELYFIYAYENLKGNCFCHAATVYWCAKELGYTVRLIEGKVRLPSGSYGPHSWVEIDLENGTFILDPESEIELGKDGYLKTYETGPSLEYRPDLPAY